MPEKFIHMKDRENLTLSKKSDGGDIYIFLHILRI